ncbi:MAG: PD-(D/E)XK nuclease family protein [Planctomycetota bacterium]
MREKPLFPPLTGKPRLSYSRLLVFLWCGVRYRFQYLERVAWRTTLAIARGAGVDEAAARDLRERCRLRLPELVEIAVATYEGELAESETSESKLELAAGKDSTADAARTYGLCVSPKTPNPALVQEPIVADLGEIELAGVPDYAVEVGGVQSPLDLKVGRERTQSDARRSRQLTGNGLLVRARTGGLPEHVGFDSIFQVRGRWLHKRVWAERKTVDYVGLINTLKAAQGGIDAGVFLPAPEGAWWCSAKWCPFHGECEFAQK